MRKIIPWIVAICLIGVGVLVLEKKLSQLPPTVTPKEAATPTSVAEQWIKEKAWTYLYDGSDLRFQSLIKTDCTTCFAAVFTFESAHGGYGDRRTDSVLTQVITPHTIKVSVKNMKAVAAVTDAVFDEFNQKMIKKTQQTTIKIYFANSQKDPAMMDCGRVYSVERSIEKTTSVARQAMTELLIGPTEQEKSLGFFTTINPKSELKSISIANGTATVDFSERFAEGVGGSCRVVAIRAQINETLKQFPSIKKVIISVEGKAEGVIEP